MSVLPRSTYFPPAETTPAHGLVMIGGELTVPVLLDAYRHGIFPWPFAEDPEDMLWWSPDPRAIIELDAMHVSRRLRQTIASGHFQITSDRDFSGVMHGCATAQDRTHETWITPQMTAAYQELFARGYAHSVEVWHQGELAGGTYGVTVGGLFAAESMFYRARDASKVALAALIKHLHERGFQLFDVQILTSHLASLGAKEVSRLEYLARLRSARLATPEFGTIS